MYMYSAFSPRTGSYEVPYLRIPTSIYAHCQDWEVCCGCNPTLQDENPRPQTLSNLSLGDGTCKGTFQI
jgi:hypothetical protein